jgi:hypothetical protein
MFVARSSLLGTRTVTVSYREGTSSTSDFVSDLSDANFKFARHVSIKVERRLDICNTDPQLDILLYEIARNGSPVLTLDIWAHAPTTCMLLDNLSGLFGNNMKLTLVVGNSRLNHHGDVWVPHIVNFVRNTPTLCCLDLGFITHIPHHLRDVLIGHSNLKELSLGHDRAQSTNQNNLFESMSNVIKHGNVTKMRITIGPLDEDSNCQVNLLPSQYIKCFKFRGGSVKELELDIFPVPAIIRRQMMRIVCFSFSVKHIAYSNHTVRCFVRDSRISGIKDCKMLLKALDINRAEDNFHNSGNDLKLWKIRAKCFLCQRAFDKWIRTLGNSSIALAGNENDVYGDEGVDESLSLFEDPTSEEGWLEKKVKILEWISRPDGENGVCALSWTFKFIGYHHHHLMSNLNAVAV